MPWYRQILWGRIAFASLVVLFLVTQVIGNLITLVLYFGR